MHAFLIIGNTQELIQKEITTRIHSWKISPWDTIRIPEEGTVGIDIIRDFERHLSMTPRNSPAKVGVLTGMDRLTVEAQNALLKTLEEPPPHTYIIGTTHSPEALLPTVLSRMNMVKLFETRETSDTTLLTTLLQSSPGKRLTLLEPYLTTRDDAKKIVSTLMAAAHQELVKHPSSTLTELIKNLLAAQSQLSVNVNQKLVVDNAVLAVV